MWPPRRKLIAGEVGIDFVAGPTEIVIIAAEGDPRWIAADMLAQAEHDVDASAILLTTSRALAEAVADEVERQLAITADCGGRAAVDRRQRSDRGGRFAGAGRGIFKRARAGASWHCTMPALLGGIRHAGSVFLGPSSPEAAGDYASGPNHVLPTSGAARLRGGLSTRRFRQGDFGAGTVAGGARRADSGDHDAGARRGTGSARAIGGGALR